MNSVICICDFFSETLIIKRSEMILHLR